MTTSPRTRPATAILALTLTLTAASTTLTACTLAPTDTVCQVTMTPENLGIVVTGGSVSGIVTVACNAPISSIHVYADLTRDRGNGVFTSMGSHGYYQVEPDGNYEATAPCVPGRWRFSYSVSVTANGESKLTSAVSDPTEVEPDDC